MHPRSPDRYVYKYMIVYSVIMYNYKSTNTNTYRAYSLFWSVFLSFSHPHLRVLFGSLMALNQQLQLVLVEAVGLGMWKTLRKAEDLPISECLDFVGEVVMIV